MVSDKFDDWEDEGLSPKKLSRTPVGVELAITAAHWLALGFTAVHRTLCPEQIFSTIFSIFLVFIDQYQHLPVKLVQTEWGRNLVHMLAWSTIIINRFLTKYVVFVEVVECNTCYRSFCASSGTRCCTICHQIHKWVLRFSNNQHHNVQLFDNVFDLQLQHLV